LADKWTVSCGGLREKDFWVVEEMSADALDSCVTLQSACIKFEQKKEDQAKQLPQKRTLYESLLSDRFSLPQTSTATDGKGRLASQILTVMNDNNSAGFTSRETPALQELAGSLVETMWKLEPHKKSFADRGIKFPEMLSSQGTPFNDFKSKKQKKPNLDARDLEDIHARLSDKSQACVTLSRLLPDVFHAIEEILSCIQKYSEYLAYQRKDTAERHLSSQPAVSQTEFQTRKHPCTTNPIRGNEKLLETMIKEEYVPFCLSMDFKEFVEMDSFQRRSFMIGLSLSFPATSFTHSFKGSHRNLIYIWRSAAKDSEDASTRIVQKILPTIPEFHTRQMRRDFSAKFGLVAKLTPAVTRSIYKFLTNDAASSNKDIDARLDYLLSNGMYSLESPRKSEQN